MKTLLFSATCFAFFSCAHAEDPTASAKESPLNQAKELIQNIVQDNNAYSDSEKTKHFMAFMNSQTPRATVVYCSDSRVQTLNFTQTPENDLFGVRNIGNQLATAEGSVDYGVEQLKTPVLMFVGHSDCGAVKAAMQDYSALAEPIKKELDTLDVQKGGDLNKEIVNNVHNQVDRAMKLFGQRVKEGKLVILGAIYDFRNDFKHGVGKLVFVNMNGERDCAQIEKSSLLKDIPGIHIGIFCERPKDSQNQ